ncbi:MAG: ABC transporter ATP-binding protein [Oscillospiraceae bacterium]|nr:ABC transporter ATP-binding protein [Oscillospiraceae bacterium]
MSNLLELKHVTKDYGSFKLEDVSFTLPGGTILGLIGENGAGKSTTIKCILNLVHQDSGSIRIFGQDNSGSNWREDIGLVLDESTFHDLLRGEDVGKILSKSYKHWDADLFARYLKQFDLPGGKEIKTYSKGMKTKLSIAAALSHHPRLLLLDEATSGLDPVVRDEILDEFLTFIQDEDHAILISSHITSDLEKAADYITYLHRGRVALQGGKDELLESYGRLVCTKAQLDGVDRGFVVGTRSSQFQCEALIQKRCDFQRIYPGLTVDPVTLEEIMVFTVRGDAK